jgi:DNA polymerase I-like protein with 3'-5' exonuclease and polymerase domains
VGLAGAAIDLKRFHKLGKEWTQDAARLHDRLTKFALRNGLEQFQATNDAHIREVIYKKLKYPPIVRTGKSKEPAVNKPTLKRLLKEHGDSPFINDLMEFNGKDKLASTWYGRADTDDSRKKPVKELIQAIPNRSDLGLLHFWIFPLRARTGRRASGGGEDGDPESRNSQNWPPAARKVVVSRFRKQGARSNIVVCDYSRLEVVLMGWRAQDAKLLDYFLRGTGYIGVAKEFWGQDVKDGTSLYKATKCLVLGLNYNMGAWHLANDLWFKNDFKFSEDWEEHVRKTKRARKKYLAMFPGLRRYIRDRIREVTDEQRVVSPSGRIRHLPHHGADSEGFWHIKNAAVNQPIQSFASDVTGSAIVDYEEALLKEHKLSYVDWHRALLDSPGDLPCSPVFNEVHDELDLDLHPRTGKRDLEILIDCMRNVRTLKKLVPEFDLKLKVDAQAVPSWGDAK